MLGFYVPPTAKVIRRRNLGLKSHPKDWRSPGSNSGPLVYKAGSLTARPQRLLKVFWTSKILINTLYKEMPPNHAEGIANREDPDRTILIWVYTVNYAYLSGKLNNGFDDKAGHPCLAYRHPPFIFTPASVH